MKPFHYSEPSTIGNALDLLKAYGEGTRVLGGGTDLIPRMKKGLVAPESIVNLSRIPELGGVRQSEDGLRIGAMVALSEIERNPLIASGYGALHQAARSVAAPSIRNSATIGGNLCLDTKCIFADQVLVQGEGIEPCFKRKGETCHLVRGSKVCHSSLAGDTVPALIALGGSVCLLTSGGERIIALENLYSGDGVRPIAVGPGEIVTEILLPPRQSNSRSEYLRFSLRRAIDFPLVSAGLYLEQKTGLCSEARVVLGAVAPKPVRLTEIENKLKGARLEDALLKECAQIAPTEALKISKSGRLDSFTRRMISSLIYRGLRRAVGEDLL